ncbi:thiol-disulfide isomerase/thioredoxin [Chryseomicrobium aureum]|uniref:thioredoxin family protein n=1 Tax=Chryseomicrobium aureum TaxID=1441723 RepID=UPI001956F496|nr:thioredoxin family protein [Chryseomicrobium aureum]MBM7705128.1 thiol-disulfide isomerase/thioredoxin [Chryseomicrobium aureum]
MKKLLLFGGVIVAAFVAIIVLTNIQNQDKLANNPYDTDNLSQSTIDLIDDENYQNIILPNELTEKLENGETATVYFFSPECSFCKEMTPVLMPLAEQEDVEILQYNILEYPEAGAEYGINSTPTLIHFEEGVEEMRAVGGMPEADIQRFFDEVVKN